MKLTFNWLNEFVDLSQPPGQIAEALTMAGLEVESLEPLTSGSEAERDWVMEIAVTPNRGDCLGILGVAREIAALTGGRLKLPASSPHSNEPEAEKRVAVRIDNPQLCPRYSARLIHNARVAPSPDWIRRRLEACGIRSINNVVDVTNYVMLETGQPLHAFDFDRLGTKTIVVRQAKEIGNFVTLDGIERKLAPDDLLICAGDTAVALAGIMGGKDSEVAVETGSILLESAHFDPLAVRRTSKRLGLHSEASHRFERGVDPEGTLYALARATLLLSEVADGRPEKGVIDCYAQRREPRPILVRDQRVEGLLGVKLKSEGVERILQSLGVKVQGRSENGVEFVPPSYRFDLCREADLIEELARIHGYSRIPSTMPLVRPQGGRLDLLLRRERRARFFLVGEGLTEMINPPFTSEQMNRRFYGLRENGGCPVSILNPLVQDSAEMRLSLIPGLLENLRTNLAQKTKGFFGFELGKVFHLDSKGAPGERLHMAGLLSGERERRGLRTKESQVTFFDAKGLVEGLLETLALDQSAEWTGCGVVPFLHPGKAASLRLGTSNMGYLGELHPDISDEVSLPLCQLFELDFEGLLQYPPRQLRACSLPRFPSVERDLAVVVDEAQPAERIIKWIKDLDHSLIEKVEVFDEYHGSSISEGKKSLAYRISYRAEDRTLTDAEVNSLHQDLIVQIGERFGAQLRG